MEHVVKRSVLKPLLAGIGICVLGLVAFGALTIFGPDKLVWRGQVNEGNELIQRIESYRREHRRLPDSVEETGIRNPDALRVFYQKCSDDRYIVWFGTTLGESMTYTSETRKWESLNRGCSDE
jgi:hypothetical protein